MTPVAYSISSKSVKQLKNGEIKKNRNVTHFIPMREKEEWGEKIKYLVYHI